MLPIQPIPEPTIQDEFSYLLAGDTYAHGRLTNPPHPMWIFFDTFQVLQHPTYASKYPPAPGMVLAVGEVLGNPWIGTLLSLGVMCMAFTWMLQGWFPANWALLGGILALVRFGIFNWFDTYLGATTAAIGGALVLGSYPRLIRSSDRRHALFLGLGAVILLLSRPLEGFIFCLPVSVALAFRLLSPRSSRTTREALRLLAPALGVLGVGLVFFGYYNWRVTGHPLLVPYTLYHHEYYNYPVFVWQKVPPPLHYSNPQFENFFNVWDRTVFRLSWRDCAVRAVLNAEVWWYYYLGHALILPLLGLPCLISDRRMRLPLVQFVLSVLGFLSVVWFQPHYAAPLAASLWVLLVQAIRHLRRFAYLGKPIGIYLTRLVPILMVAWIPIHVRHVAQLRLTFTPWTVERAKIVGQLRSVPGNHLVLVDYSADHRVDRGEWVYNAADIDSSRIVWVRVIPGRDLTPLLSYFEDRQIWILHPDNSPPRVERACVPENRDPIVPCAKP